MELRQLKYLLAIQDEGTLTAAAEVALSDPLGFYGEMAATVVLLQRNLHKFSEKNLCTSKNMTINFIEL